MSDIAVHPRKLEYVCATCLFSVMGTDVMPIPWCPRCGIRLTPDDPDTPRARQPLHRVIAAAPALGTRHKPSGHRAR